MKVSVIVENENYLVVNKPSGIIVERSPHESDTLEHRVERYLSRGIANKMSFVGVVHRLDRVTSGAIIFAKNRNALKLFNEEIRAKRIRKTYLAIVENLPSEKAATLSHHLYKDQKNKKAIIYTEATKTTVPCKLSYRLLKTLGEGYLLEVRLFTGRFHQIRAQLAHIDCPIIADEKYGSKKDYRTNSICLHSYKLGFTDPITKEKMLVTAALPSDKFWEA